MRLGLRVSFLRRYSSSAPFIPPASLQSVDPPPTIIPSPSGQLRPNRQPNALPSSPTFYTTRPSFHDHVLLLEDSIRATNTALRKAHLLPLSPALPRPPPPDPIALKPRADLATLIGTSLSTSTHRRVSSLLTQLHGLKSLAQRGGEQDIAKNVAEILAPYERDLMQKTSTKRQYRLKMDDEGRIYALGKRKESAARVWIIPVWSPNPSQPQTSTVLVNSLPLAKYFVHPIDRQRVMRPLMLAGVMGAYNVFTIVRGGGTTGQAGAVAHGIAKALVGHLPDAELILRRAKLLRRDPRMVERKKAGFAKARKKYAWVKR